MSGDNIVDSFLNWTDRLKRLKYCCMMIWHALNLRLCSCNFRQKNGLSSQLYIATGNSVTQMPSGKSHSYSIDSFTSSGLSGLNPRFLRTEAVCNTRAKSRENVPPTDPMRITRHIESNSWKIKLCFTQYNLYISIGNIVLAWSICY